MKSVAKKTLIGTLGAAGFFVAGTTAASADTITIASGDTVSAYAAKYNVSIDDIVKANKLADANLIIAGKTINIPGVDTSAASSTADTTVAASSTTDTASASSSTTDTTSAAASTTTDTTSAAGTVAGTNNGGSTAPAASTTLDTSSVVSLAQQLATMNIPYSWGGSSLSGMDCSGLVAYVYANAAGKSLAHNTVALESEVTSESVSAAQPGDLLFWGNPGSTYHVAIYIGGGQYVAAPDEGQNVQVQSINSYFMPSFAGRVN